MNKDYENRCAFTLLERGTAAFPEILHQIRSARQEILIRMFIWREDNIGTAIAEELLKAADRGVRIVIEKDRYGLLLEYAEESQLSFCHIPDLWDRFQIRMLCLAYNRDLFLKQLQTEQSALYRKLKEHPHVIMQDNIKTMDHSKYYIFDGSLMILGGINIEDKEYLSDSRGRVYYDCMVKINDADIVSQFLYKRIFPKEKNELFRVNAKKPVRCFELKDSFLELIESTEKELIIMMAYIAPDQEIFSAVSRALNRGADVKIVIPRSANYMNDMNRYTVSKLLRQTGGRLSVFMTDYMLHAKIMMNEKYIMTGSCNINQKSFSRLGELNICADNDDSPFAHQVRAAAEEVIRNCSHTDSCNIRYNRFLALLERIIMR